MAEGKTDKELIQMEERLRVNLEASGGSDSAARAEAGDLGTSGGKSIAETEAEARLKLKQAQLEEENETNRKPEQVLINFREVGDSGEGPRSFAILPEQRNTEDNPTRESSNTMPYLVRRVNSEVSTTLYILIIKDILTLEQEKVFLVAHHNF